MPKALLVEVLTKFLLEILAAELLVVAFFTEVLRVEVDFEDVELLLRVLFGVLFGDVATTDLRATAFFAAPTAFGLAESGFAAIGFVVFGFTVLGFADFGFTTFGFTANFFATAFFTTAVFGFAVTFFAPAFSATAFFTIAVFETAVLLDLLVRVVVAITLPISLDLMKSVYHESLLFQALAV